MKKYAIWVCIGVSIAVMQAAAQSPETNSTAHVKGAALRAANKEASLAPVAKPVVAAAKTGDGSSMSKLPVRRVVLYKNGVGYFEHLGGVRASESVHIDFTSGQLNDVLKSLTILDLNGGQITGVDYNSEAPLNQLLGALRLPLGEKTSVAEFLGALRGARLEARNGTSATTGRLLSVERKTRVSGGTTLEVDVISLVSDSGEVRELELTPAVSVRLLENDLNQEVHHYLGLLASERDQDLRRMVISTAGTGERKLYVSYISEVPIWKTTYRIVLPTKADSKPLLQGWAVVDNTVGEDWKDVQLSLVAGEPQSFVMQLSQPYYSRRPSVALPESAQLTPQTHEGTMRNGFATIRGNVTDPTGAVVAGTQIRLLNDSGQILASTTTDSGGNYQFAGLAAGNFRLETEKIGFRSNIVQNVTVNSASETRQDFMLQLGAATDSVTVTAEASTVNTQSSLLSANGRNLGSGGALGSGRTGQFQAGVGGGIGSGAGGGLSPKMVTNMPLNGRGLQERLLDLQAAATGQELGDLFEYRVKEPVTIHKNQSALVPILQTNVETDKVSLWNPSLNSVRPLRALWLKNSSDLTLDGGSFSVLEDDTFAGEGLMDPVKPGEKRLLSYAVDLGVRVDSKLESEQQRVRHVKIEHGVMIQTREVREKRIYFVRNEDSSQRTVVIEHPVRTGWKLAAEAPKPEEASAGHYRFRVAVEPKSTSILTIAESMPLDQRYEITDVDTDQVALFIKQGSVNAEVEQALRKIIEQKVRVAGFEEEVSTRNTETASIYDDQQRLRENIKSLKGSAEERSLTQRYIRQLDDQETRLDTLRREIADFQKKQQQAQAELDKMIEELSMNVTL